MTSQQVPFPQAAIPQALKQLYFPASTPLNPPEHYDRGLPRRAVEGGLQGVIAAWLNMSEGDQANVYFGDPAAPVWSKTISDPGEVDNDVLFTIPEAQVRDGDITPVFYEVIRKNQAPEESTPRMTLLAKLDRPGGPDPDPTEDGHGAFKFTLSHTDIDPSLPPAGVEMRIQPYPFLTKYDRIIAYWGSERVVELVTPEQAQDPLNHPLIVHFPRAVIEQAGDGSRIPVAFQPVDRTGNFPDDYARWSAVTFVNVDLANNRLAEPQVLVKGVPTTRIDLALLGDDDVIVRVYATSTDFAVNDELRVTWTGISPDGKPIVVTPAAQTVSFVPNHFDFAIDNASVKAIAQGSASVGYVRARAGEADRTSKKASVIVVGDVFELEAPTVDEAPDGHLPPDTRWANVRIPWYPGRDPSDLVTLIWEATTAGGNRVYHEDARTVGSVPPGQPILRSVDNAEILRFDGLLVRVFYVVTDSATGLMSVRESKSFMMQVGNAVPKYEKPKVDGEKNSWLDPDDVAPSGATVRAPYLGTQDKDVVTCYWNGSKPNGSTREFVTLIPATAGKEVILTVPKEFVIRNDAGEVDVHYDIRRAGVVLGRSHSLNMRIGTAQLDLPLPRLQKSNAGVLDPTDPENQEGVNIQVEYADHRPGDKVKIIVKGADGVGSPVSEWLSFNANNRVNFAQGKPFVAKNMGKPLTIEYLLQRDGEERGSPVLNASILTIPDDSPLMPKPIIDDESGNELDVKALTANSKLRVAEWILQTPGQRGWVRYHGVINGQSASFEDLKGDVLEGQSGLTRIVPWDWIQQLDDNSILEISVFININGELNEAKTVRLPERNYIIISKKISTLETFDEIPSKTISAGESIRTPTINIEFIRGQKTVQVAFLPPPHYPGEIENKVLFLDGNMFDGMQHIRITPNTPCSGVKFYYLNQYVRFNVDFYNKDHLIGSKPILPYTHPYTIEFEAKSITHFEIVNSQPFYMDNITLKRT